MRVYFGHRFPQMFLIAILIASVVMAIHAHAQTQDTVNALMQKDLVALAAQASALTEEKLPQRVSILEDEMGEVKWLARGATAALFGQLAIALRRRPSRNASPQQAEEEV